MDDDNRPPVPPSAKKKRKSPPPRSQHEQEEESSSSLIASLRTIDPILRFLLKATGNTSVPRQLLLKALPTVGVLEMDLLILADWKIIHHDEKNDRFGLSSLIPSSSSSSHEDHHAAAGTASTPGSSSGGRGDDANSSAAASNHYGATTQRAAQKRLTLLRKLVLLQEKKNKKGANHQNQQKQPPPPPPPPPVLLVSDRPLPDSAAFSDAEEEEVQEEEGHGPDVHDDKNDINDEGKKRHAASNVTPDTIDAPILPSSQNGGEEAAARTALLTILQLRVAERGETDTPRIPSSLLLPHQVSYAGSTAAHAADYAELPSDIRSQIPNVLYEALVSGRRKLYTHQVAAITAALSNRHCSVGTGTGSGKSLCYLLPTLTAAYNDNRTSLLLFPTKALAQDQLTKLHSLVSTHPDLAARIRPGTLDGDTLQSQRRSIAEHCNIILTNPDTLHASLLPHWKTQYKSLFVNNDRPIAYVVIDEAHVYDGIFGAHVAMVIRRLIRLCGGGAGSHPTFITTSATLPFPQERFAQLVGTTKKYNGNSDDDDDDDDGDNNITVLTSAEDGSPRAAKHFLVWNPPVLNMDGSSVNSVYFPKHHPGPKNAAAAVDDCSPTSTLPPVESPPNLDSFEPTPTIIMTGGPGEDRIVAPPQQQYKRRHAADETARLLARAVANGVRCIAWSNGSFPGPSNSSGSIPQHST
jgi:DEAD/DEAH box helicase